MPRVSQPRTSPVVSSTTTPAKGRPAPAPAASSAWKTSGPKAAPRAILDALRPTLVTLESKPLGPAKLASTTIAGVPVKRATELEYTGLTQGRTLASRAVEVSFGKVSKPQFDALKAEFGGKSQVPFEPAREYGVIDFLPPAMQALAGKDLDTGGDVTVKVTRRLADEMRVGDQNLSIGSTPNCHGTAWEMMRAYQGQSGAHVQLGYGDFNTASASYDAFTSLGVTAPETKPDLSKLKPGDVVAMSSWDPDSKAELDLLHSAVYVGGGLFFEKPDTEHDVYGESPYRLATFDQITAALTDAKGDASFSVHQRRPTKPLAPLAQEFASGDTAAIEAILARKGQTLGKQLVSEFIMGMGGTIRGVAVNAVLTQQLSVGADGRGVLK